MENKDKETVNIECECWHEHTPCHVMYQDFGTGVMLAAYFGQDRVSVIIDGIVKDVKTGMSVEQLMNLQCELQRIADKRRGEQS